MGLGLFLGAALEATDTPQLYIPEEVIEYCITDDEGINRCEKVRLRVEKPKRTDWLDDGVRAYCYAISEPCSPSIPGLQWPDDGGP